jgi:predicted SnoaL-like aldol condensation-catalyzing enzyme
MFYKAALKGTMQGNVPIRGVLKVNEVYYISMNINDTMSQIELNKAIIQRYFEAYNNKNEAIFDDIISPDYIDHGQSAYMGSPGRGIAGAKINYTIEAMIASAAYPDLVGTYWKGSCTPNVTTSETLQSSKIIEYRGVSIHRIQNGKMVETWHVVEGWPLKIQQEIGEV